MNKIEFEAALKDIAELLDAIVTEAIGKKGFCLILFDFNAPGVGNYVSNANRQDMITVLEETVKRLKNKEDIPAVYPTIQ